MKKLILFLALSSLLSCSKDIEPIPTAEITIKSNGEGNFSFNVSAANADTFEWDFGDGGSSFQKLPTYTFEKNGQFVVTLKAKGKGGEVIKTEKITVSNITGSATFWMTRMRDKNIEVYVDGKFAGIISGFYSNGLPPGCGAKYCATIAGLSEGQHVFEAKEQNALLPTKWNNTIMITGRQCTSRNLQY